MHTCIHIIFYTFIDTCEVLTTASLTVCKMCSKRKARERVNKHRASKKSVADGRTNPSSHVPYSCLSREEMQQRMSNLHSELRKIQKKNNRLKEKLAKKIADEGLKLDATTEEDMKKIMAENEMLNSSEESQNTRFKKMFWQQQSQALKVKDARGMRWHPMMVKWCIYLHHQSQGAYETLRQTGCIALPSSRTLRDYTHCFKASPGFTNEIDTQLCETANINTSEKAKPILLLIDEMYVKEDLVFDKHTGELTGFTNLGNINNDLQAIERALTSENADDLKLNAKSVLANSVTTFMVRGLLTSLQFPYVYFPCRNISGDLLFDPFWEAISRLERNGFKVKLYNM